MTDQHIIDTIAELFAKVDMNHISSYNPSTENYQCCCGGWANKDLGFRKHQAEVFLAALRGNGIEVADGEALRERLADEIETTLTAHEPRNNDSHCTCGVRNNMDGDVLHSHRMTQIDAAIRQALENR